MKVAVYCCLVLSCAVLGVHAQANAHAGKAIQLMQERRYSEAAQEFAQSLATEPNNDAVRIQYATCLFLQERNDEARTQFEIERKRLGEQPGINYFLGQLDLRANNTALAIQRLQPLAANPAFPKASLYLGLAYLAEGKEVEAQEALERAAKNSPRDPEAHYRLARQYSLAGREEEAKREYKIYDDARETRRLVEGEGRACLDALREKPIEQARTTCQIIADGQDPRRMLWLGQLYAGRGAYADALEPLRVAVKLDPDSFDGWHTLGLSLYWLKQYQEALAALQKAARLNPDFFDTLNLLAATYHALGNDTAALPVLEKAHALNPGDAKLAAALERMRAAQKARE